ncbi:PH domain-containing protein [Erysipelotrichaceae bacterium OttesenSCG-928-M19]|nr:PH domain-containing protein [Erysipelotrichaceae bacterium OttesenSCG-928-M19]
MLIINIIVVVLTIILQYLNLYTITRTLRIKDNFMYLRLISNEYVFGTIKPYKMKTLMYNRLLLIITIVIAPFFVWLNNSTIIMVCYLIIFIILPFLINQFLFSKYIKEFQELNIASDNQEFDNIYLGILFSDEDYLTIKQYGFHRYAINLATIKGKLLITAIISLIIILFAVLLIFVKPVESNQAKVEGTITTTHLAINYDTTNLQVPLKDISAIEKIETLPTVVSKVEGVQENNYISGVFNLQGFDKANVNVKKDTKFFLQIKAGKQYYFYSESNEDNMNVIYQTILKQVSAKKKEQQ